MAVKIRSLSWSFWFISIDLFFVFVTVLDAYVPVSLRNSFLHHFDLGIENNLASWWSAMNFLILGLLAYEFFSVRVDPYKRAWVILAGIYAFLSLDELGSIHERLHSWPHLLPVAVLIGVGYLVVLYQLLPNRETRNMALWIVFGSALMLSVAFQEYVEHIVHWPAWVTGIRTGVEEGTELLGAYLILRQFIRYRLQKGLVGDSTLKAALPDPLRMRHMPAVLLVGLVIHSLVSLLVVFNLREIDLGNPSVWYISALFFILSCASYWMFNTYSGKGTRWFWVGLSTLFLLDSFMIIYLILPRHPDSRVYALGLFANIYFLFAIQSFFILIGYIASYGFRSLPKIAALLGLGLALIFVSRLQNLSLEFILIGVYTCSMAFICFSGTEKTRSLASVVQK